MSTKLITLPKRTISNDIQEVEFDSNYDFNNINLAVFDPENHRIVSKYNLYIRNLSGEFDYTINGIHNVIKIGENEKYEFKEKIENDKIIKELTAFANSDGGYVFIGIRDDGTIIGVNDSPNKVRDDLQNSINNNLDPPIGISVQSIEQVAQDKRIIVVYTPKSEQKPIYFRNQGRIFVRAGSTNRPANRDEIIALARGTSPW